MLESERQAVYRERKKEKKHDWHIFDYNKLIDRRFTIIYIHWMKKMVCLITSIDFLSIQPFLRPLFSGHQELSKLDYYFQNGGKTGAQTNQCFCKLNNIFWWSKISHIIIKGWNYMIKSFSGQVVFCFAILRAISAYVGENWLSQYSTDLSATPSKSLLFSLSFLLSYEFR